MKRKVFFTAIILLALGGLLSAQHPVKPKVSEQSWRVLAKAQVAFDRADYGEAIALCEDARKSRGKELKWNSYVMQNTLSSPEVKKKGPFISDLMPVLKDREDFEALEIINAWLDRKGADYFDNSLPKLFEYLKRLNEYPECDFLLAKIYRLEGEYDLAMQFLKNSMKQIDLLDVPAQKYDIYYEAADLAKVIGNQNEWESYLLLVVANDGLYKDEASKRAMVRTVGLKRKDLVNYFFMLHRYSAVNSIRAYFELGQFYKSQKKIRDYWNMTADGVVCAFTWTLEILRDRNPEYTFKNLEGFFEECGRYEDVLAWANKNGVWKGFYEMAQSAIQNGWLNFGMNLLQTMASSCPDKYWAAAAKKAALDYAQPAEQAPAGQESAQ
ncbi:MAG: hypothetical protein IK015_01495 [Treponema sp.]|nr:hypothetical protein [Treponema sp.]